MWELLDAATDTRATEVPGAGVIIGVPGMGLTFVPRTRLVMLKQPINGATHIIQRDERNAPPIKAGATAQELREKQGAAPVDPGASAYYTQDDPDY